MSSFKNFSVCKGSFNYGKSERQNFKAERRRLGFEPIYDTKSEDDSLLYGVGELTHFSNTFQH